MLTEVVHHAVLKELYKRGVELEMMILKPSMVIAGKDYQDQSTSKEVAEQTIRLFNRTVPATIPAINFLSGVPNL